jgi:hypothetical protein
MPTADDLTHPRVHIVHVASLLNPRPVIGSLGNTRDGKGLKAIKGITFDACHPMSALNLRKRSLRLSLTLNPAHPAPALLTASRESGR